MAAINSPEDVVNAALRALGWPRPIGDIYEGSPAARAALERYSQARDELLRGTFPSFARRAGIALTLLKSAPGGGYSPAAPWTTANPPWPWLYEYAYPADCIEIRALLPLPQALPVLDPRPARWRIDDDESASPAQKVILADVPNAQAVYCARVTNPARWDAGFTGEFIAAMAAHLARALGADPKAKAEEAQEAAAIGEMAMAHRG